MKMTALRLAVAVPMKPLALAKQRLRPVLAEAERLALAEGMLAHVLATVQESGVAGAAGVVSRDPAVLATAARFGFVAIADAPRGGYNAAAWRAARWARAMAASALLLLPADLPHLTPADVRGLADAARDAARALVIAPDAAETGTNALLLRPPDLLRPRFGPDSFPRHLALAAAAGVEAVIYRSPTLAHDVDLPVDLAEMAAA